MKKIIVSIMLFTGLYTAPVMAQENISSLQYSMGFSMGDFGDFIGRASFRGATFDYTRKLNLNVGVGFEIAWNVFYEDLDYDTYTVETSSISGKQYRYCSAVPILFTANYYLKPTELLTPFAGLGIGTMYTGNELDMGVYAWTEDEWHFVLRPEIGVLVHMSPSTEFFISGKYYNAFKTENIGTRNYITANIGLAWRY